MRNVLSFAVGLTFSAIAVHYFTGVNIIVEAVATAKQLIIELI